MILTVTLNTSIDKLYLMTGIQPETVMRVKEVHNTAGGKGLNVSRIAGKLGEEVAATGFVGGFNGRNALLHQLLGSVRREVHRISGTRRSGHRGGCVPFPRRF